MHEIEIDYLHPWGWVWACSCGEGADGFETEADAVNDALDHEETGR